MNNIAFIMPKTHLSNTYGFKIRIYQSAVKILYRGVKIFYNNTVNV